MGHVISSSWNNSLRFFGVFKKILLVLFVFSVVISLFKLWAFNDIHSTQNVDAESLRLKAVYKLINDPTALKTDEQKASVAAARGLLCAFTGETCANSEKESARFVKLSLMGRLSYYASLPLANPPASGVTWTKDTLAQSHLIPEAYAWQGVGFSAMNGYLSIWSLFRDISYMLFVFFILIVGFLVMFRVQMGGQASIAIESALPRIVIALLVITFSFAIAGFLIDAMYVIISLGISILSKTGHLVYKGDPATDLYYFQKEYLYAGFGELFPPVTSSIRTGSAIWELLPGWMQAVGDTVVMFTVKHYLLSFILDTPKQAIDSLKGIQAATFSWGNAPGWLSLLLTLILQFVISPFIPGIVMGFLIGITVFLNTVKIFFIVLGSFIKIILYVIFAPFILLFDVIPGNGTLGWWLRNLIGELMVFPTIILVMLAGRVIMHANSTTMLNSICRDNGVCNYMSDYSKAFRLPFLYGFQADDVNMLISLGLVLVIPDFIRMVKGWVGVKDMGINFGLGTFFSGVSGLTSGGFGIYSGFQQFRKSLVGFNYQDGEKGVSSIPGFKWLDTFFGKK